MENITCYDCDKQLVITHFDIERCTKYVKDEKGYVIGHYRFCFECKERRDAIENMVESGE